MRGEGGAVSSGKQNVRLAEAKACTDRLIEGEAVEIFVDSEEQAEELGQAASQLGAVVQGQQVV